MKTDISLLWLKVGEIRQRQLLYLFILTVLSSFAEILSIGAIIPFLAVLSAPEQLYEYPVLSPILNFFGEINNEKFLLIFTLIFILSVLISGVMRLFLLWSQTRLSFAIGADLSNEIYKKTLHQSYKQLVLKNSSEVIASVSQKTNEVVHLVILPILVALSSAILILAILITLLFIEPIVSISVFIGFGLIYLAIIMFSKKMVQRDSKIATFEQGKLIKSLQEGMGGIRDILINHNQEIYCEKFRKIDCRLRRARANVQIISGSPRFIIEAIGMILIAIFAFSLLDESDSLSSSIPVLGAMAFGAQRLLPALQQLYASLTLVNGGHAQLHDVLTALNQSMPDAIRQIDNEKKQMEFNNDIVLDGVSFNYIDEGHKILRKIELKIKKGSCIGLIGTTGSGKSTLIDIIMGLLEPTSGSIRIDGYEVNRDNKKMWQRHVSHVPQSIFLMDSTIKENIAVGVEIENIDMNRVYYAAKKAQIHETVESLDLKYDTVGGENGVPLSGGQRQRIGIARALYREADVIIFDEATSALDTETENNVMESIGSIQNDITIIIIAHRLTTLSKCSQVIRLEGGKVAQIGTYNEIIAENKINSNGALSSELSK